jgi:putative ABC transport system permease protein
LIAQLKAEWEALIPSVPFEYQFIDAEVAQQYAADRQLAQIINGFTLLAILISCLGLFGLATFTAARKTKEVGIRKVLGASVPGLVGLLAGEFLRPVGIALLIATPLAWYGMRRWLDQFAYRTEIEWWVFLLAGSLALAIAFLTVGLQAIRAALAHPVNSLRNE